MCPGVTIPSMSFSQRSSASSLLFFHQCVDQQRQAAREACTQEEKQPLPGCWYLGFAVPSCNLCHHRLWSPLIWRAHGKSSTLKTQERFCLQDGANIPLCSDLNTDTRARACANFDLSLGFAVLAERRCYCGLRIGWAVALSSKCVCWHLLAAVPFLSNTNEPGGFHPLLTELLLLLRRKGTALTRARSRCQGSWLGLYGRDGATPLPLHSCSGLWVTSPPIPREHLLHPEPLRCHRLAGTDTVM